VDLEKIKENREWSTPSNVIDVMYFMGLTGNYRIFIIGFSRILHLINHFQKKGIKFEWTSNCEERFQFFKELCTSAPILKFDHPNQNFVVCTNACKEGLSGLLT
jgi:hypothetical protein